MADKKGLNFITDVEVYKVRKCKLVKAEEYMVNPSLYKAIPLEASNKMVLDRQFIKRLKNVSGNNSGYYTVGKSVSLDRNKILNIAKEVLKKNNVSYAYVELFGYSSYWELLNSEQSTMRITIRTTNVNYKDLINYNVRLVWDIHTIEVKDIPETTAEYDFNTFYYTVLEEEDVGLTYAVNKKFMVNECSASPYGFTIIPKRLPTLTSLCRVPSDNILERLPYTPSIFSNKLEDYEFYLLDTEPSSLLYIDHIDPADLPQQENFRYKRRKRKWLNSPWK